MANLSFQGGVNMDTLHVGAFMGMDINAATSTQLVLSSGAQRVVFTGQNFTYDANAQIVGGTITGLNWTLSSGHSIDFSGLSVPVPSANQWFYADDTLAALSYALSGGDQGTGSAGSDVIRGFGGNDTLSGGGAFDDLNGMTGDDVVIGGDGDDWVVGGQDQDTLYGGVGADIVYGNLGNDTCLGEDGDDLIRGGQANDRLDGGAGNDWLSGDRGDDTVTGGAGADIFHSFSDAGWDYVTDFSSAQGDRVQLDPGTVYTVEQVGADTVVRMANANLVLQNVQMSSLQSGWIFGA